MKMWLRVCVGVRVCARARVRTHAHAWKTCVHACSRNMPGNTINKQKC